MSQDISVSALFKHSTWAGLGHASITTAFSQYGCRKIMLKQDTRFLICTDEPSKRAFLHLDLLNKPNKWISDLKRHAFGEGMHLYDVDCSNVQHTTVKVFKIFKHFVIYQIVLNVQCQNDN